MLWPDITKASRADDAEAHQEHVGVGVGDEVQHFVVLLAPRVKQW